MLLKTPFLISARLLPAIKVAGCIISLEHIGYDQRGADNYSAHFDFPDGREFTDGPVSGFQNTQGMFGTLLCFLSACGEGRRYERTDGRESENSELFAEPIAEWAEMNSDEISMIQYEIEETAGLIEE